MTATLQGAPRREVGCPPLSSSQLPWVTSLSGSRTQLILKILTFLKEVEASQGVCGFQLTGNGLQSTLDRLSGPLAAPLGSAGLERLKIATDRSALLSALSQRSLVCVAHGRACTRPRLRRCRLLGHRLLLVGWLQPCAYAEVDEVNNVVTRQARTEEKHGRSSDRVRRQPRRQHPISPKPRRLCRDPGAGDPFNGFPQAALRLRADLCASAPRRGRDSEWPIGSPACPVWPA